MEIAQKEKAALLEWAVINSSVEELSKIYDGLGFVEMTAPALGLACRFRGLDMVSALVQKGASFEFPLTVETEEKYRCYIGHNYRNYRTNYSLYLLKVFRGEMKGACCLKGMAMNKKHKREAGKPLPFLSDDERVKVLNYLFANKEKIAFEPEEMLFYAIFAKDAVIREELRRLGVRLSQMRVHIAADCGKAKESGYWYEYSTMTGKLADEDYRDVMQQLQLELDGKPFHYTEKIFDITKNRFHDTDIFEYFISHFKQDKMKKYQIIRDLIDEDILEVLPVIERAGWLSVPKKRDELIEYASENKKTEALAWLLDYKNRTADFAAEQEKADKKLMRELNRSMSPDSVTTLKKSWNYKKQEDGTLMITSYKGTDTEVAVPEKIGKSIVTAIGNGAFIGAGGRVDIVIYASFEQMQRRRRITRITLPATIRNIGIGAFAELPVLQEITIPEGVEEIREHIFFMCGSLKEITIPGTVKKIGKHAFANCGGLEEVHICEGVKEIGERAFRDCGHLRKIHVPESVQRLITATNPYGSCGYDVFSGCPNLTIYCPKGSKTEAYCMEKGFRFENSVDQRRQ